MKIGIVGAGQVGATAAYAMTMRGVGSEIVLVDRNTDLAVAQAHDILDATPRTSALGEFVLRDGSGQVFEECGFAAVRGPRAEHMWQQDTPHFRHRLSG